MSQNLLMAIPAIAISGLQGVLIGGGAIIGFGVGRSFGKMSCDKLDYIQDNLSASVLPKYDLFSEKISSFSERWR
tara:strand:- start:268 stop:492 length:225 start_codon:yes stop_codon:yes gene_type:complete